MLGTIIPWMFSYAVANDPGSRRLVAKLSPGLGEMLMLLLLLFSLSPLCWCCWCWCCSWFVAGKAVSG